MSQLYKIHFLNRRGSRVWEIPLAGTTIARRSMLVPANLGREPLRMEYHEATQLVDRLNENLSLVGLPGRCFPMIDLPRIDLMAGCREICG